MALLTEQYSDGHSQHTPNAARDRSQEIIGIKSIIFRVLTTIGSQLDGFPHLAFHLYETNLSSDHGYVTFDSDAKAYFSSHPKQKERFITLMREAYDPDIGFFTINQEDLRIEFQNPLKP